MSADFDFSPLSDQWLNEQGPMKMLHRMNQARLYFVQSAVEKEQMGLDIGSGAGIFPLAMAQEGYNITALEKSSSLAQVGMKRAEQKNLPLNWVQKDFQNFEPDHLYDYVTCFEVIEHIEDVESFLKKCVQVVKPQGQIIVSTLNRTLISYLTAVVGAEYFMKLLPIGSHDYKLFLKPEELSQMLDGASPVEIRGLVYNPLTSKFFLGASRSINYIGRWIKD